MSGYLDNLDSGIMIKKLTLLKIDYYVFFRLPGRVYLHKH